MIAALGCVVPRLDARADAAPAVLADAEAAATAVAAPGASPVAYDILMLPRGPGATRSRLWTGRGWVTLRDQTAPRLGGPGGGTGLERDRWNRFPRDRFARGFDLDRRDLRVMPRDGTGWWGRGDDRRWRGNETDRRWRGMEPPPARWAYERSTDHVRGWRRP
jgi:hypothetical protein